jgi:HK97 family phage prohead protease
VNPRAGAAFARARRRPRTTVLAGEEPTMPIERLNLTAPLEVKQLTEGTGEFVGYAAFYGNLDHVGDIVERGAFTKTISERPTVKILYQHSPMMPVGLGRLEDSDVGLILRGTLNLDKQLGRDCYSDLKAGIIDSLSIGYEAVKTARAANGARILKEIRLFEVSLVTFPANELARVLGVKHSDPLLDEIRALNAEMRASLTEQEIRSVLAENLAATKALVRQVRAGSEALRRASGR